MKTRVLSAPRLRRAGLGSSRSDIDKQYLSYQSAPLAPVERHALVGLPQLQQRISFLARREAQQVGTGDAIGQIAIPTLGASYTMVQGTDTASLEEGPGHYPATAFPGLGQTVAIAGHRTPTWPRSATSTRSNRAIASC